jgi:ABC-2 type transport system ATP-binding protein
MIATEKLIKKFGDFTAVYHLNLSVKPRQILILLGRNGAGKITTTRMLTSIFRPTDGRAWVAGFDAVKDAQKVRNSVVVSGIC